MDASMANSEPNAVPGGDGTSDWATGAMQPDGPGRRFARFALCEQSGVREMARLLHRIQHMSSSAGVRGALGEIMFIMRGMRYRFSGAGITPWDATDARVRLTVGGRLMQLAKSVAGKVLKAHTANHANFILAAWQVTFSGAYKKRGMHKDKPLQGDAVITLTIEGGGTVYIEPAEKGPVLKVKQGVGDSYSLFEVGLTDGKHGVQAGARGRVSVTFRFVRRSA